MSKLAILVGNSSYDTQRQLDCCSDDVAAISELISATQKFDAIETIFNADSTTLKTKLRLAVDAYSSIEELFFYFTGHGHQHNSEFYFCATNFDSKRPNETGLSISELHTLLKSISAGLVVTVIDACSSGALLIKSDDSIIVPPKGSFRNLIQISSCLDSQNSLTGSPLSVFTEKFRDAALRKDAGPVFYSDIINVLRDEFIDNNNQTPHFISQGTGREDFVDDATKLNQLKSALAARTAIPSSDNSNAPIADTPLTTLAILQNAEHRYPTKVAAQTFISDFFEKLSRKAKEDLFGDLFESQVVEHSNYVEQTTRAFIIRVLSNEKRPDNFVTAEITKEQKRKDPWKLQSIAAGLWGNADEVVTHYELTLNCDLDKAQLRITLTPKFITLKRLVLVVSCAPSLEHCYIMEMLTTHALKDWGVYDDDGTEVVRRWYKKGWAQSTDGVVNSIYQKLNESIQASVAEAEKALTQT